LLSDRTETTSHPIRSGWKLRDFASGAGRTDGVHLPAYADDDWIDVAVPGDVHRALIETGRIPDPFYDRNETDCAWMEQREWWYRAHFETPREAMDADVRQELVFHGLDTFATVYLNANILGEHHNMFRPAVFDVTARLRAGERNTVAIRFDPPLERIKGKTLSTWGRNPERTAMRKAQFGYGWDWGPRLPTIGIWRPVELRQRRRAALVGVQFSTLDITPTAERAAVAIRLEADRFGTQAPLTARIQLTDSSGKDAPEISVSLDGEGAALETVAYLSVERPRLWWTHELGQPELYDLTVSLYEGRTLLDQDQRRVGIRTLTLDQSPDPDEPGTRFFRFVLNGVPIFAKGADWIPCDSLVGAIGYERYTALLEMARDANMTMLRIWGGGIYEHDHVYAECDRLGLLVWQDFMFACAMYPEDDADFVADVDAEARYQVRRLRSHACLALWCGNNENQWLHERYHWDRPSLPPYGAVYYDSILSRAVADLDGRTPYWPGSPYGGNDHNSRDEGNVHNWDVWHGNYPRKFGQQPRRDNTPAAVSYRRYQEDLGRFVSEFGMHAAPVPETLWRVIPSDERYQHSPSLDWHNKDNPKNKGDNLLVATTGLPADLDEYIRFSQMAQAEGLKFGVEHYRRRKPHCSGTLVWQFDDCWPVLSWSVVDYYGFPKAGYYFLRRAYAPVLASFKYASAGSLELWLTNDLLSAVTDSVTVRLGTFSGQTHWQQTRELSVQAGASACMWRWLPEQVAATPEQYVSVRSAGSAFPANRYFFGELKDLVRRPTAPHMDVTRVSDHELRVQLRAPDTSYVYFANLTSPHESVRFSDNYVDLEPGETRQIMVADPLHELAPESLRPGWG
jgi:beta-mannosidase